MGDTRDPTQSRNGTVLLDKVAEDLGGGGVVTQRLDLFGIPQPDDRASSSNGTCLSVRVGNGTELASSWTTPHGHTYFRGNTSLFDDPFVYAVVEGADEGDAFSRGLAGEAVPLESFASGGVPALDRFRWAHSGRVIACHMEEEWSKAFFGLYVPDGPVDEWPEVPWERVDASGLVLCVAEAVSSGSLTKGLGQLILRSLVEADEELDENQGDGLGRVDLGRLDPEFVRVCVQAIAVLHVGEEPKGKAAVLELPKAAGHIERRFLFFGRVREGI